MLATASPSIGGLDARYWMSAPTRLCAATPKAFASRRRGGQSGAATASMLDMAGKALDE
jgi:hypothetical protein